MKVRVKIYEAAWIKIRTDPEAPGAPVVLSMESNGQPISALQFSLRDAERTLSALQRVVHHLRGAQGKEG